MEFIINFSDLFEGQLDDLSDDGIKIVVDKIKLVKQNPYRYKNIFWPGLCLFRIRFTDMRKEKRIMYLVDGAVVLFLCILARKKEYKDLKHYLHKMGLI